MQDHPVVTREEWLIARRALLEEERAVTHRLDRLRKARRALPWVAVTEPYRFEAPGGEVGLADLFGPRSQLAVYHFMLPPDGDHICQGCAFLADHVDAARAHFEQADLSFVAISRAPLARIEAVRRRFGWRFAWVSAGEGRFTRDHGVAFTPAEIAAGLPLYNYGTSPHLHPDLHGVSIFARDEAGRIFHTYSAYARGAEQLLGAFAWLDLAPKGRNEEGTMSWVRLRDTYGAAPAASCCAAE